MLDQIKEKLQKSNVVEKLIYSLIIVFFIENLIRTFSFFQNTKSLNFIQQHFSLSVLFSDLLLKPYTLLTYGFLHGGFIHLIFNLIVLFYIGNLFLDYFNEKKMLLYFLLGSVFGGIFFLLSYNYFSIFKNDNAYLVGASAGITAIMVGLAVHIPNYKLHFRFVGLVKLSVLATIWVVLSLVLIPNGNAGGQLAHLGGAFIGFVLTLYFNKNKFVKKAFTKKEKSNLKTVYRNPKGITNYQKNSIEQRKIDGLLDKISKSGYEILTKEEKEFLDSIGNN